jgi:hypothetical protein
MSKMNCALRTISLLLVLLAGAPWTSSQVANQPNSLTLAPDKDSVVRFFFFPSHNNYFHVALLFRVVEEGDPRWNTAPVFDEGRTAYISFSEMRSLFAALSAEPLSWEESAKIEELETPKTIRGDGRMDIKILSSGGTAKSGIPPKQMCETLAKLDATLRMPRALWEFQYFRFQFDCPVPNFDPKAYPDRVP